MCNYNLNEVSRKKPRETKSVPQKARNYSLEIWYTLIERHKASEPTLTVFNLV